MAENSTIRVFEEEFSEVKFQFQILKLRNQIYVWIGSKELVMGDVVAAVPPKFDPIPSVTTLIGGTADGSGEGIARRLTLKTGLSIVLSYGVKDSSQLTEALLEKRVLKELQSMEAIQS